MKKGKVVTTWEVWTYDVWGNEEEGFEVNDRSCIDRNLELILDIEVNNPGTPQEFLSANPTNQQIREALGVKPRIKLELDGDDTYIYVNAEKNGFPLGEMSCTSHESLSPIRAKEEKK